MNHTVETQPSFVAAPIVPPVSLREEKRADVVPAKFVYENDSLFDRFAWLYVFFRERIFRDDTGRIVRALWPDGSPLAGSNLLELGCGPGFYSCEIAKTFPQISVFGIDRAAKQLRCAERKAEALRLRNCRFESDNVLDLSHPDQSFDALIAARLFTILPNHKQAVAEMYRVLRTSGRCLVAEPRFAFWASLPLLAMWFLARLTGMTNGFCEPRKAIVLSKVGFRKLFESQPWKRIKTWQDGRYQYALCEKG